MKTSFLLIISAALVLPAPAQLALIRQGSDSIGTMEAGEWHGAAVALGDFDNDGYDDLAAGAPFEKTGSPTFTSGHVVVSPGGVYGLKWDGAYGLSVIDASLDPAQSHQMGKALAVGNFNNDNYDDLAVGLPASTVNGEPGAGRVMIYLGGPGGLPGAASPIHQGMLGAAVDAGDNFGASLAAGRLGEDEYDDLVIGAPGENGDTGVVIVIRGGPLGPNLAQRQVIFGADLGAANVAGDRFGYAVAIGNVIGFPAGELIVGAPFAELTQGVPASGRVYIANSSESAVSAAAMVLSPMDMGDQLWVNGHFGAALAIGDLWGDDSTLDLAIGAPGSHAGGRVYLGRGSPLGISWPVTLAQPPGWGADTANDEFGAALACGDHDDDGDDELAAGCPGQDVFLAVTPDSGSVHIFNGGPAGPSAASVTNYIDIDLGEEVTGEGRLGYALAAGRTSASPRRSICAGAPRRDGDTGQVFDIAPWRQVIRPSCRSALAADCENNIVYALRPFDEVKIASTTKTMTVLLACEATARPQSDPLHVGLQETYTIESWMFEAFPLTSGCSIFEFPPAPVNLLPQTFTFEDLLYACIFPSGNDASFAIADAMTSEISSWIGTTGSAPQFVELMNDRAEEIGMNDTFFTNPAGTDPGNPYSTAYDMYLLSKTAMDNPLFREVVGSTSWPMEKIVAGAEAGMFAEASINLQYGWLQTLQGIDSRVAGIKPGNTPGAKRTGLAAGRYGESDTKLAFATGFRFPDGNTLDAKIVALVELGLSFCNTDLNPPGGITGPVAHQTWQVNDGRLQAIEFGSFDGTADPAASPAEKERIEIQGWDWEVEASWSLRWKYRALWELAPGATTGVIIDPVVGGDVTLRHVSDFGTRPPGNAVLVLDGTQHPSPETLLLPPDTDMHPARWKNFRSANERCELTIRNAGTETVYLSFAATFELTAATSTDPKDYFSAMLEPLLPSLRTSHLLCESPPADPRVPQFPVDIIVQDPSRGLRFLPPLALTDFSVRPSTGRPEDEITVTLRPGSRFPLDPFLSGMEIQTSPDMKAGTWTRVKQIDTAGAASYPWTGVLPASQRRFLRAVGIPVK